MRPSFAWRLGLPSRTSTRALLGAISGDVSAREDLLQEPDERIPYILAKLIHARDLRRGQELEGRARLGAGHSLGIR